MLKRLFKNFLVDDDEAGKVLGDFEKVFGARVALRHKGYEGFLCTICVCNTHFRTVGRFEDFSEEIAKQFIYGAYNEHNNTTYLYPINSESKLITIKNGKRLSDRHPFNALTSSEEFRDFVKSDHKKY